MHINVDKKTPRFNWTVTLAICAVMIVPFILCAQIYLISETDRTSAFHLTSSNIIRVYDGDTFYVTLPDVPAVMGQNIGVRIRGIDAPEMRSSCKIASEKRASKVAARTAQAALSTMLKDAKVIELVDVKRDKYFRLLADVEADGIDVAKALLAAGLARPYDGGKKQAWCK